MGEAAGEQTPATPGPSLGIPEQAAAAWVKRHGDAVAEAVGRCGDVRALWRIAALVGYDDGEGRPQ